MRVDKRSGLHCDRFDDAKKDLGPPGKNASHYADLEDEEPIHDLKLCDMQKIESKYRLLSFREDGNKFR